MLQESPVIPHTWTQWVWVIIASFLGYAGSALKEWISKRRSPAEERKTDAETFRIHVDTNISLVQAVATAISKAERLQRERDHWELKAFDLQVELKEARDETAQMTTQARLDNHQIRRQMAFIEMKNLKGEYLLLDKPKDS